MAHLSHRRTKVDLSQIVAMARECGCYYVNDDGAMMICEQCARVAEAVAEEG